MALKKIDRAAYAVCRTFIAAGAAAWDAWAAAGRGTWPATRPSSDELVETIFQYIPRITIVVPADDPVGDNCPTEEERAPDPVQGTGCRAAVYSIVFSPTNRARMIAALDMLAPADVRAAFKDVPPDGGDLEWWATALTAGALILVGGLPFAGAAVVKIAGILLAAWTAYGFVTPKTPGGKSIAEKWADAAADGFDALKKGAGDLFSGLVKAVAFGVGAYVLVKLVSGSR